MTQLRAEPLWQHNYETDVALVDPLSKIYNEGQWKLNKVSPLYNLQYDPVKVKQYAVKIRQDIVRNVAANSSLKYSVVVDTEPHLKYSEDDPHGLVISITCSSHNINSKSKLAYICALLSWGVNTKLSDSIHLPYLLEKGEQKLGAAVKSTLQTIFDCNIKQFSFNQHQLLRFGLKFLEYDMSRDSEQFVMVFKTPQVDYKDKLTFSFDIGDMRIIWNGAKEEVSKPSELVNLAYQVIQAQIFHMVTMDVSAFELTEVLLPKGAVKDNGIIKMKSSEIVNVVFTVLNEISSLHLLQEL